jgi:hypothetical protein
MHYMNSYWHYGWSCLAWIVLAAFLIWTIAEMVISSRKNRNPDASQQEGSN